MKHVCDHCGYRAAVRVYNTALSLTLEFCSHHYNEHRGVLLATGWYTVNYLGEENV